jgi:hypothetical protein
LNEIRHRLLHFSHVVDLAAHSWML